MPFANSSIVLKAAEVPNDDLSKMATIKGEIAGKLGKLIVEEYKADKVVLSFKDAEKLKDNKKLAGKKSLTYTVEVDGKGKKLEFCVQSAKKEIVRVTLLDDLDKLGGGATVVNMDKGDATIDKASAKQAKKFNGPTATANDETEKLKGLNLKKKIVLCGHGGGPDVSGDQQYTASEFGGKTADEIVKFLIKKGLSSSYSGTIYLSGCHTAAGYGDPKSFASKVHSTFASKGYKSLSVAGTPGEAWTKDSGDKGAIPSAMSEDLAKSITKSKKLLDNLEKALDAGEKDLVKVEAQVKQLELEYASRRELILDMPPEAHDLLEQKLLVPTKKSRDELVPAMLEMQKSNKTLAGAIKSEKAYHAKLTDLAKDKKKLQEGKITQSEYQRKEEDLFTVEDWWGVFGPAKATSAKVQKDNDKIGSLFSQFKAKFSKSKTKV
jgi:hypothetical protein